MAWRRAALLAILVVYALVAFQPYQFRIPKHFTNNPRFGADGAVTFVKPGILEGARPPAWIDALIAGAPMALDLAVIPAEPNRWLDGRILTLSTGEHRRLLSLDRHGPELWIYLRSRLTNLNGGPPLIVPDVFADGVPVRIGLALVGSVLTVDVDGQRRLHVTFPDDPRRTWDRAHRLAIGNEHDLLRHFLGTVARATLQVGERSYDLLSPDQVTRPRWLWYLHRIPRLVPLADLDSRDGVVNILGFMPLGLVAATLPGATLWSVLTLGLAVSGTIEFVQLLVPGRFPSIDDVLCNTLGALIGWALARLGRRLLRTG